MRRREVLARTLSCLGISVLGCILLAAALVVWFFASWRHAARGRDFGSQAAVTVSADRLRGRLEDADADGVLTEQEIIDALQHRPARSLVREQDRTVLVVQVAASGWAQCYAYIALPTGSVGQRPLKSCPTATTSAPYQDPSRTSAR
ncbi:hypothetical protein [Streptomyces sp. NPDC057616]|uniref:hypothetical protein n=1 Tax=Streptomyces sp. NPDC057616 TaxID=3346183 RepID=UPI0036CBCC91